MKAKHTVYLSFKKFAPNYIHYSKINTFTFNIKF